MSEEKNESDEYENFYKKFSGTIRKILIFICTPVLALVVGSLYFRVIIPPAADLEKWLVTFVSSIQVLVIALVVSIPHKLYKGILGKNYRESFLLIDSAEPDAMQACGYGVEAKWRTAKKNAVEDLKLYRRYWNCIWISWFLEYAVLCFLQTEYVTEKGIHLLREDVLNVLLAFFNNTSALGILFCYSVLKQSGDSLKNKTNDSHPNRISINLVGWIVFVVVLAALEFFAFIFGPKTPEFRANVGTVFIGISGVFTGIVTALYTGRLDSKFLNFPVLFLVLLYAYAAIQPLMFTFSGVNALPSDENGKVWLTAFVISSTLFFKLVLFIFMIKAFYNGRLLFYFLKTRLSADNLNTDWAKFDKILIKNWKRV